MITKYAVRMLAAAMAVLWLSLGAACASDSPDGQSNSTSTTDPSGSGTTAVQDRGPDNLNPNNPVTGSGG